jgi:putative hydrolase of the HAD superfamily
MSGLLHEHAEVDIDGYLDYVHDVDVSQYLAPDPALAKMLEELPVPKAIFTNSICDWAERVTQQLGVRHLFEHIFDVRAVGYRSKPDPHAYSWVLETLKVPGETCVMLDDQPTYLAGATKAGMTTILVHPEASQTNGVDYKVERLLDAEPILRDLLDI